MIEWHGSDRHTLGNRIAATRIEAGIKQHDLAKRVGLKVEALARIESGAGDCTPGLLSMLAQAMGVPYRTLRGDAPRPPQ